MKDVLAVVLGGGAGVRLIPLTLKRSKPAVPLGGKYRLIDVPVSNCINSGINRIFILTQFNSASLNHHVTATYRFSIFSKGFVDILSAEQTHAGHHWFRGTADAVRQTLQHLAVYPFDDLLVLSGDQLYAMDYLPMIALHRERGAAITVATTPVAAGDASGFGILKTDDDGRIVKFVEKPPADRLAGLESETDDELRAQGRVYLASMGIYLFRREVAFDLLTEHPDLHDFGRHVIPLAIDQLPVHGYAFDGYWTDIGTIRSFYEANLALTEPLPRLNLYDVDRPIYTHARMLPPTKAQGAQVTRSIVAEGSVLETCRIEHSVVGIRSMIGPGTQVTDSIVMGADFFETAAAKVANAASGRPSVGIGAGCRLEGVIVDKNVRMGNGVVIRRQEGRGDFDSDRYYVRDGLVIIPKDTVLADGTVI